MNPAILTVDVRQDIRDGGDPFAKIMIAVVALEPGQQLLLIAPFKPVPLFHVLRSKGFEHHARALPSGDWEVLFTPAIHAPAELPQPETANARAGWVDVDARGLEPPQPMVKILETLSTLPAGMELRAKTDRRPMHLYPHLEERGFSAKTEAQADGSFLTYVCLV